MTRSVQGATAPGRASHQTLSHDITRGNRYLGTCVGQRPRPSGQIRSLAVAVRSRTGVSGGLVGDGAPNGSPSRVTGAAFNGVGDDRRAGPSSVQVSTRDIFPGASPFDPGCPSNGVRPTGRGRRRGSPLEPLARSTARAVRGGHSYGDQLVAVGAPPVCGVLNPRSDVGAEGLRCAGR